MVGCDFPGAPIRDQRSQALDLMPSNLRLEKWIDLAVFGLSAIPISAPSVLRKR